MNVSLLLYKYIFLCAYVNGLLVTLAVALLYFMPLLVKTTYGTYFSPKTSPFSAFKESIILIGTLS